jgi:hypothetical protein
VSLTGSARLRREGGHRQAADGLLLAVAVLAITEPSVPSVTPLKVPEA